MNDKDDQAYNLPEQNHSPNTQPENNDPLGKEPAVNMMRQRLNNFHSAPDDSAGEQHNHQQSQNVATPSPPPLNPHAHSVHGRVEEDTSNRSVEDVKKQLLNSVRGSSSARRNRIKPFLIALAAGLLYLGVSYNEVAIAQVKQYLSPGSNLSTPVIVDPTNNEVEVTKESRIIIPKINVDVPVVYDVTTYDEQAIQNALERGVVHYGNTAVPGETGNNVIVGHSSNNFFNSGRYKFAFVLLGRLEVGDTFILHYGGQRYIYKVSLKRIIEPNDFSLIQPTDVPTTTLITCTPPGTSWQRLVIQGEQISPDPDGATQSNNEVVEDLDEVDTVVPSNAPSFWDNFFNIFD